ncbi:hypothetical protein CONLIGDRAFT_141873 [Coniochaeta ligniaria NRRL 30616]|uniref:Uncharacterized protein n=1 Tax=Coniochaeta ligniaria NRRL 30616 TaxID=1408157 RepID=A0A1J7J6Y1_9PEZI|nr:hypothetical protein CONLIGDRAFT_141873 [Coniochaeta ligniaria NRRL 30616]
MPRPGAVTHNVCPLPRYSTWSMAVRPCVSLQCRATTKSLVFQDCYWANNCRRGSTTLSVADTNWNRVSNNLGSEFPVCLSSVPESHACWYPMLIAAETFCGRSPTFLQAQSVNCASTLQSLPRPAVSSHLVGGPQPSIPYSRRRQCRHRS